MNKTFNMSMKRTGIFAFALIVLLLVFSLAGGAVSYADDGIAAPAEQTAPETAQEQADAAPSGDAQNGDAPLGEAPLGDAQPRTALSEAESEITITIEDSDAGLVENNKALTVEVTDAQRLYNDVTDLQHQNLQEIIDQAVSEGTHKILLSAGEYSGFVLNGNDSTNVIEIEGEEKDGAATVIKGDIGIASAFVRLVNIIFGGDKIVINEEGIIELEKKNSSGETEIKESVNVYTGDKIILKDDGTAVEEKNPLQAGGGDSGGLSAGSAECVQVKAKEADKVNITSEAGTVNIAGVDADSAALTIKGSEININGSINAADVTIEATDNTKPGRTEILNVLIEFITEIDKFAAGNIVHNAVVNVNGNINSAKDIAISAIIKQTGVIIPIDQVAINVKKGTAKININPESELTAGGNITLLTKTEVDAGYNDDGGRISSWVPIALNIVVEDNGISIDNAILTAESISAKATSKVKVAALARYNKALAIALNVVVNDVFVTAKDSELTARGGNIELISNAVTDAVSFAERNNYSADISASEVFVETNVVNQHSKAKLEGKSTALAKFGKVLIDSTSDAEAVGNALSSEPDGMPDSGTGAGELSLKKVLGGILQPLLTEIAKKIPFGSLLQSTINSFCDPGYAVSIDDSATKNAKGEEVGKVHAAASHTGDGVPNITVTVDSKYVVDKVLIRYINPQSTSYSFAEATLQENTNGNVFKYTMPNETGHAMTVKAFRVYVFYTDTLKEVYVEPESDIIIQDIFNASTGSATTEFEEDFDCASDKNDGVALLINSYEQQSLTTGSGKIVTNATAAVTKDTTSLGSVSKVAPGKYVRFIANPNVPGVKLNSLSAEYTTLSGKTETVQITPDALGHYILWIPYNISKAEGSHCITIRAVFDENPTVPADESKDENPAANQMTGAVSVGVVINSNTAAVESNNAINARNLELKGTAKTVVASVADGTTIPVSGETANSAGGGIAVSVLKHNNKVYIINADISAENISLNAAGAGNARTVSKSGAVKADTGVSGSVSVSVCSFNNSAEIKNSAKIHPLGGEKISISVTASSDISKEQAHFESNADSGFETTADATKSTAKAGNTGVGVGIAVAVNGSDAKAAIEDGLKFNGTVGSITVSSSNVVDGDKTIAKASEGSQGTSVVPSVALDIFGSYSEAYLGRLKELDDSKDYKITADSASISAINSSLHQIIVNAGASGVKAAGAAIGIAILNEKADAALNTLLDSIRALDLLADSRSEAELTVKTSSYGAAKAPQAPQDGDKGKTDKKADGIINGGAALSDLAGSKGSTDSKEIKELSKDRQSAQTSEGSVGVAASLALNIQKNTAEAEIKDGVTIDAADSNEHITVSSVNKTSANVKADGSAVMPKTGNETGVGVGVAINIVNKTNRAYFGTGLTKAGDIVVKAATPAENDADRFDTSAISAALSGDVGVAGSVAIAVINSDTTAELKKTESDVFSAKSVSVKAFTVSEANTSATASDINVEGQTNVGVGASFAMIYGANSTVAKLTLPSDSSAGAVTVISESNHSEITIAEAGNNPADYLTKIQDGLADIYGKAAEISVDAAVAVNAVDVTVLARLDTVTSGNTLNVKTVRVSAKEKGSAKVKADGAARGVSTSVGATAAANINSSEVNAEVLCLLKVSGDDYDDPDDPSQRRRAVEITSSSEITEESVSKATAFGSDTLLYITKLKGYLNTIGKIADYSELLLKLVKGELFEEVYEQVKDTVSPNQIAKFLTNRLAGNGSANPFSLSAFFPLSTNLLKSKDTKVPDTKELDSTAKEAAEKSSGASGVNTGSNTESKNSESVQVAAAVSVGVSSHKALAKAVKDIEATGNNAGGVKIATDVAVDSINHATAEAINRSGLSIDSDPKGLAIAAAIAVEVDENKAESSCGGNITAGRGKDVSITSALSVNSKADYEKEIGIQAISVSLGQGQKGISGSIAVFVNSSEVIAKLLEAESNGKSILGYDNSEVGNVEISAVEMARRSLRSDAATATGGSIALGAGVGVFTSNATITASVGNNSKIKARSIKVNAEKRSYVPASQREKAVGEIQTEEGKSDYGSGSESSDDDPADKGQTTVRTLINGLFGDIFIFGADTGSVETVLNKDKIDEYVKSVVNQFANVDNYIEVISGTVGTSSSGAAGIAGAVAVAIFSDTVKAEIGENAELETVASSEDGNITVSAVCDNVNRVITGGISLTTSSTATVGATISFVKESCKVTASVGNGAYIKSAGSYIQTAVNSGVTENYTAAPSVGIGKSGANVAAVINVLLADSETTAFLGNAKTGTINTVVKSACVKAANSKELLLIALSPAVSGGASVQAGGVVAVIVDKSKAKSTAAGTGFTVENLGYVKGSMQVENAIEISAENRHNLSSIVASASVAAGGAANVAGVLSVIVDESKAEVDASDSIFKSNETDPSQKAGNIIIRAADDSTVMNVNVQAAASASSVNVGAAVTTSIFNRTVSAKADRTVIRCLNGNVQVSAESGDRIITVAGGASGTSGTAVSGTVLVVVRNNTVTVSAQSADVYTQLVALEELKPDYTYAKFTASHSGEIYGIAGSASLSVGSAAVGATVVVLVDSNTIKTDVSDSKVDSYNDTWVAAEGSSRIVLASVSGGVAAGVGVDGSVITAVISDSIQTILDGADIAAAIAVIKAEGRSSENYITGAASVSAATAVAPTVAVIVKQRDIDISALVKEGEKGRIGNIYGITGVKASAVADDRISSLVISAGVAGGTTVEAGICTIVIKNDILINISEPVYGGNRRNVELEAKQNTEIVNYNFGAGVAAGCSVVPVATVIYLESSTKTRVSGDVTAYKLSVSAKDNRFMRLFAAGAAVGAGTAVSGTVAVIVSKAVTEASFTGSLTDVMEIADPKKIAGSSMSVTAGSDNDIRTYMLTVADSGGVSVGVAAAVTVVKDTLSASVNPQGSKKSIISDSVSVLAESKHNVKNLVGGVGFGVTGGVGVNVAVLVAGSKVPQDAFESISGTESKPGSFNSGNFLTEISNRNAYANSKGYLNGITLGDDFQGNGKRDSELNVGGSDGIDTKIIPDKLTDGDVSGEYSTSGDSDVNEGAHPRGENTEITPSSDISGAADINAAYTYTEAVKNTVSAIIDNVDIKTEDLTLGADAVTNAKLDVINVTAGGYFGVGIGTAVAVAHSNVDAIFGSNATARVGRTHVYANSTGDKVSALGGAAGASGTAGVGVAVAVVHLDSVTNALIKGTVAKNRDFKYADTLDVTARNKFGTVSAKTVAAGGGIVGVGASVAVVVMNAETNAKISGSVSGIYSAEIKTEVNSSSEVSAAGLAAGGVGVNAGVAVLVDSSKTTAELASGAVLDNIPNIAIQNDGAENASANLAGIGAGGVNVGASVAVVVLKSEVKALSNGKITASTSDVWIKNNFETNASSKVISGSAAGVSVGANVVLAFNRTKALAQVAGNVDADSLHLTSFLTANSYAGMKGLSLGSTQIGATVAYAELAARNESLIGNAPVINVKNLDIAAGSKTYQKEQTGAAFNAEADVIAGGGNLGISVNANVAVAINKAVNTAKLDADGKVKADTVTIMAFGNPKATAAVTFVNAGLENIAGGASAAVLEFSQNAEIKSTGALVGTTTAQPVIFIISQANGFSELEKNQKHVSATTEVYAASLGDIKANVAVAKNNMKSLAKADIEGKIGRLEMDNNGGANAYAEVKNSSVSVVGIGADVVLSYVKAEFETTYVGGGFDSTGAIVALRTDYVSNAESKAEAGIKGVSVKGAEIQANVVISKSTTTAKSSMDAKTGANLIVGSASVALTGRNSTKASLDEGKVNVSVATIGAKIVEAILENQQYSYVKGFTVDGASGNVSVSSEEKNCHAEATLTPATGASVHAAEIKVNVVIAKNHSQNSAYIENISGSGRLKAVKIAASADDPAIANVGNRNTTEGFSVAVAGIGVIVAKANDCSINKAYADSFNVNADSIAVLAEMKEIYAQATGGASSNGAVQLASIDTNISKALVDAQNLAYIQNSVANIKDVTVKAASENVYADSFIGTSKVNVGVVNIAANIANADNNFVGKAYIEKSTLTGTGSLNVESSSSSGSTRAVVGSSGSSETNVSLIGTKANKATANSNAEISATVKETELHDYKAGINAYGTSNASADVSTGTSVGLLVANVMLTEANSGGSVTAEYLAAGKESVLNSLAISASGSGSASAVEHVAGGSATSVTVVGGDVNKAVARSNFQVKTLLDGNNLKTTGDVNLASSGSQDVKAEAQTPNFSLAALKVAVNKAIAESKLNVLTEVKAGTYNIGGRLSATASVPSTSRDSDANKTVAKVAPSAAGDSSSTSVALIKADVNTAESTSEHNVKVIIGDGTTGRIDAGSFLAEATGNGAAEATADNHGTSVSLFSGGSIKADAEDKDVTEVEINMPVINTNSGFSASAGNSSADARAVTAAPGKITVIGIATPSTTAASLTESVAKVIVKAGAEINNKAGDLSLNASNSGVTRSKFKNDPSFSLLSFGTIEVPTEAKYNTNVVVEGGSKVKSGGKVNIGITSKSEAINELDSAASSSALSIRGVKGTTTVTNTNSVEIGNGAVVSGDSGVNVTMDARTQDIAGLQCENGFNLIEGSSINSEMTYNQNNRITLGENAELSSSNGAVSLKETANDTDLTSQAHFNTGGSLISVDKVEANNTATINNSIALGKAAEIVSKGSLNVLQEGGANKLNAKAYLNAGGGAISVRRANAYNTLTIGNQINAAEGSKLKAGGALNIEQGTGKLFNDTYVNMYCGSFTLIGDNDLTAKSNIAINNNVSADSSAELTGSKGVYTTSSDPSSAYGCNSAKAEKNVKGFIDTGNTKTENKLTKNTSIPGQLEGFDIVNYRYNPKNDVSSTSHSDDGGRISAPFAVKLAYDDFRTRPNKRPNPSAKSSALYRLTISEIVAEVKENVAATAYHKVEQIVQTATTIAYERIIVGNENDNFGKQFLFSVDDGGAYLDPVKMELNLVHCREFALFLDEMDGDWLFDRVGDQPLKTYCGPIGQYTDKCTVEELLQAREHHLIRESYKRNENNKSITTYAVTDEQGNVVHRVYFVYNYLTGDHSAYAVGEDGNWILQSILCYKIDGELYYFYYDETTEEESMFVWINEDYDSGEESDTFMIAPMSKSHLSILGMKIDREQYLNDVDKIKNGIAKYGRDFDPNLVLEDRNTAA